MNGLCIISGCGKVGRIIRGMCSKHYSRTLRHGDPLIETRRAPGTGHKRADGYLQIFRRGRDELEHKIVAETALGRPLPIGAVVHHIDGDRSNNAPSNLVICPSHAYHQMIHRRQRAVDACGNADWRKCSFCKQYDDPVAMVKRSSSNSRFHNACKVRYNREKKNVSI